MGAAGAYLMKGAKFEEKFLAPALEETLNRQLGAHSNAGLAKAIAASDGGRDEEAWRLLHDNLQERPNDPDSAAALWDLAGKMGRRKQAWPPILRQLKLELRGGDRQLALQRWEQYSLDLVPEQADGELRWRLAEAYLQALEQLGWRVLADRRWAGSKRANVDFRGGALGRKCGVLGQGLGPR